MIAILVISDGRATYLRRTIESLREQVSGDIVERWIYDDSGERKVRESVAKDYPDFTLINHPSGKRQGFAGAVRTAWDALRSESIADWVLHVEQDFTWNRPVDLADLQNVMTKRPNLAQIAMLRQAWNSQEIEAGGLIETNPDCYIPHLDGQGREWLEHDLFFTTNPSLYRRSLIDMFDWPEGLESEGRFGIKLKEAGFRFAFWGARDDGPLVHHIGDERTGTGY